MASGIAGQETEADAEALAVLALSHLAADPQLLSRFFALSGLTADGLRAAAGEPGFLPGVLAFFLSHEPDLAALAAATGRRPEEFAAAHRRLAGPDVAEPF